MAITLRTRRETLTFAHPFTFGDRAEVQPAGAYTVQTDEEAIEGISFLTYRRIATVIFLPLRTGGAGSFQALTVTRQELEGAQARDGISR